MGSLDLLNFVKSGNALRDPAVYDAVVNQWTSALNMEDDHARWFLDEYSESIDRLIDRGGRIFRAKVIAGQSHLPPDAWYVSASTLLRLGYDRKDIEIREVSPGVVCNVWSNIWLGPDYACCFLTQ